MITKEKAIEITKQYLASRNREYDRISSSILSKNKDIPYGKYEDEKKDVFVVSYEMEGYQLPIIHFVNIEAKTGEVLFTVTPHGYAEEWED